jgi:hypothetical protein
MGRRSAEAHGEATLNENGTQMVRLRSSHAFLMDLISLIESGYALIISGKSGISASSAFYFLRNSPWTGRTTACTKRSEVMNVNRSPDIPVRAFIGQGCPIYEGVE